MLAWFLLSCDVDVFTVENKGNSIEINTTLSMFLRSGLLVLLGFLAR